MAKSPLDGILEYLRTVMRGQAFTAQPDVDLVHCFISQGDDDAFAALLKRHGPMVLGLCRRVLHDEQLAEDAFQATFLLLARDARKLRKQRSVASWLHGVALRVARNAKRTCAKANRPDLRNVCHSSQNPPDEVSWRETLDILDVELQRLPDKYRLPLVLCYLEGMPRDEAAAQLGWTPGKLRGQLERARDQLRSRLIRRGVTLAAAGAGVLLADTALAARVPPLLAVATVKAALRLAAGNALAACGVSVSVITLAQGGVSVMTLKTIAVVSALLVTGLIGAGAGIMASPRGALPEQETRKSAAPSKVAEIKQQVAGPRLPAADAFGDLLPPGALARFGSIRWRHGDRIHLSAMTPDGKRLVTASGSSIFVWDPANGKLLRMVESDPDDDSSIWNITISPDGKRLGYCRFDSFCCMRDLETGNVLRHFGMDLKEQDKKIRSCRFTADGKEFIVADSDRIMFWDLEKDEEKLSVPTLSARLLSSDGGLSIDFSYKDIIVGTARTGAVIGTLVDSFHHLGNAEEAVAIAPDSRSLAVVNPTKDEIQIWELPTLKRQGSIPLPKSARNPRYPEHVTCQIGYSANSKELLLSTWAGSIYRWHLATGTELATLEKQFTTGFGASSGFHYLPDGKTILTAGSDGVIRRWDAASGKEYADHSCYAGAACAALSPDGSWAAVADCGGRLDLWDTRTGKILRTIRKNGPCIAKLSIAPNGQSLAVGFQLGSVSLYDVPSGRETKVLWQNPKNDDGSELWMHLLLFNSDGQRLYANDHVNGSRVWNVATGALMWQDETHTHAGGDWPTAAWTADGNAILAHLDVQQVSLLNAATGQKQSTVTLPPIESSWQPRVYAIAYSPDGRRIAMGYNDESIALCDAKTLKELKRIKTEGPLAEYAWGPPGAFGLAFPSDGKWLITDGPSATVRIWDTFTLTEVLRLEGHVGQVNTVAFSPDGKTALSSASDGQTYLWDLRPKADSKAKPSLESLWTDLASADSKVAYRATWALSDDPKAVNFLAKKIPAVQPVDSKTLAKLVTDLSSDNFQSRQAATKTLSDMGDRAAAALTEALKKPASLEAAQRMRRLLDAVEGELPPSVLQQMRALKALELAGTEPARGLLQQWSVGAAGTRLTEESKAALLRLGKRDR